MAVWPNNVDHGEGRGGENCVLWCNRQATGYSTRPVIGRNRGEDSYMINQANIEQNLIFFLHFQWEPLGSIPVP